jgi:cysteinyl-tRNA synthetase
MWNKVEVLDCQQYNSIIKFDLVKLVKSRHWWISIRDITKATTNNIVRTWEEIQHYENTIATNNYQIRLATVHTENGSLFISAHEGVLHNFKGLYEHFVTNGRPNKMVITEYKFSVPTPFELKYTPIVLDLDKLKLYLRKRNQSYI